MTAACDRIATERAEAQRTVAQLRMLAKEAINGWACHARSNKEREEIARLYQAVLAAGGAPSPQENEGEP